MVWNTLTNSVAKTNKGWGKQYTELQRAENHCPDRENCSDSRMETFKFVMMNLVASVVVVVNAKCTKLRCYWWWLKGTFCPIVCALCWYVVLKYIDANCSHVDVPRAGNDDELDSQNRNCVGKLAMSAYNGWMQPEESRKIALRHTTYEGRSWRHLWQFPFT